MVLNQVDESDIHDRMLKPINSYWGKSICSLRRRYKASQDFLLYTQLVQHNGSDAPNICLWETLLAVNVSRWQKPRDLTFQKMGLSLTMSLPHWQKGNTPTTPVPESHRLVHWNYFGISNQFLYLIFEWDWRGLCLLACLNLFTSRMTGSVPNQCWVERTDLHLYNRFHTLTLVNTQRFRSEQCPLPAQGNICVAWARGWRLTFSPISCPVIRPVNGLFWSLAYIFYPCCCFCLSSLSFFLPTVINILPLHNIHVLNVATLPCSGHPSAQRNEENKVLVKQF